MIDRRGDRRTPPHRRARITCALAAAVALLSGCGSSTVPTATVDPSAAVAHLSASPSPPLSPSPSPSPSPTPVPSPSPSPTPVLVPDPLDGVLVSPEVAARHPIAVMVDDLAAARPQSGFTAASVVWQAPAEGGIPRYMLVFGEGDPPAVGPVRSARQYYIAWASEWHALYVHVGGSPQALATLAAQGSGQLVFNADEFRWGGGRYLWRVTTRSAPHNVYTDGQHLRALAVRVGATAAPSGPLWRFAPDAPLSQRPTGGTITVVYPYNTIRYTYDRASNTYVRGVTGARVETDATTKKVVAPKNVVIMYMHFGPLTASPPDKKRLEADLTGSGKAWISTNGRTIVGTWRKDTFSGPTRFYDGDGNEVTLTVGQTFVQVLPTGSTVTIVPGAAPTPPTEIPLTRSLID